MQLDQKGHGREVYGSRCTSQSISSPIGSRNTPWRGTVVGVNKRRVNNMPTVELTKDTFEETILGNDTVLVDFWAERCGP